MSTAVRRILVVEDDGDQLLALQDRLTREGYRVDQALDGDQGARRALSGVYDLLILDVMLPGRNGFEIAAEVRRGGLETPILMLTARGEVADKVVGLNSGADDYLTKPFEFLELLARITALLRRTDGAVAAPSGDVLELGDVTVDFRSAEVYRGVEPISLSATEFELLHYLARNRGAVVSRGRLLDEVWGYYALPTTRTVDMHIARLRQKLEPRPAEPQYILTVRGLGYKLAPAGVT